MSEATKFALMEFGADIVKLGCVVYLAYRFAHLFKVIVKQAIKEALKECGYDAHH
jgi:hypothetical protein